MGSGYGYYSKQKHFGQLANEGKCASRQPDADAQGCRFGEGCDSELRRDLVQGKEVQQVHQKYIWVLVNKAQGIVIFFYDEGSRGRKVLTDFLGEADLKALMSDGITPKFLDGELEKTERLIYMAHARVKLEKAYQHGEGPVANEFADMIYDLYYLKTDMR